MVLTQTIEFQARTLSYDQTTFSFVLQYELDTDFPSLLHCWVSLFARFDWVLNSSLLNRSSSHNSTCWGRHMLCRHCLLCRSLKYQPYQDRIIERSKQDLSNMSILSHSVKHAYHHQLVECRQISAVISCDGFDHPE